MAYDNELADRIRFALAEHTVREVKMFGGLSFMVNERMAVSANGHGDLMVRCDPERMTELLGRPGAQVAEMGRGRKMSQGWIRITEEGIGRDEDFDFWIEAALEHNRQETGGAPPARRKRAKGGSRG